MKIIVTNTEAKELVAAALSPKLSIGQDDITIIGDTQSNGMNYVEAISRIIYVDFPQTYQTNQKIAAIKKLREYVSGLGLAEAKVAVEQPFEAIKCYLQYGKYKQLY